MATGTGTHAFLFLLEFGDVYRACKNLFMKSDLEKLDDRMIWTCVGIFVLMCIGSWMLAKHISAPEYEVEEIGIEVPYTFSTNRTSHYLPAWHHENFSSPEIVLYDPVHNKSAAVSDEYLPELQSVMPPSKYGAFYHRWFWVMLVLFIAISAFVVFYLLQKVCDNILYQKIKKNPDFKDCAYFLYRSRLSKRKEVEELIPLTIQQYCDSKLPEIAQKYDPKLVGLITSMLETIYKYKSTVIEYNFFYRQKFIPQKEDLQKALDYWKSKTQSDEYASTMVERARTLLAQNYIDIECDIKKEDLSDIMSDQLNELFRDIMEEPIFKFQAFDMWSKSSDIRRLVKNELKVEVFARNCHTYFTWPSGLSDNKVIPGITLNVIVSKGSDESRKVLWDTWLQPVTSYSAESFDAKDMYADMVKKTLKTFTRKLLENAKK